MCKAHDAFAAGWEAVAVNGLWPNGTDGSQPPNTLVTVAKTGRSRKQVEDDLQELLDRADQARAAGHSRWHR